MPWEEAISNNDYIISIVKCILRTKIERKIFLFQSGILWKNMPRRKEMNMDKRLWI
jgi:hypothetical protein